MVPSLPLYTGTNIGRLERHQRVGGLTPRLKAWETHEVGGRCLLLPTRYLLSGSFLLFAFSLLVSGVPCFRLLFFPSSSVVFALVILLALLTFFFRFLIRVRLCCCTLPRHYWVVWNFWFIEKKCIYTAHRINKI